jgi:hypothetical protein
MSRSSSYPGAKTREVVNDNWILAIMTPSKPYAPSFLNGFANWKIKLQIATSLPLYWEYL